MHPFLFFENINKPVSNILPQPLRDYIGRDVSMIEWKRLGFGAYQFPIDVKEDGVMARLLKIPAGSPVPEHSHCGNELTLVLSGAYNDSTGTYNRGDFQEADDSLEHQPQAEDNEDCICLVVTDAPLVFKSLISVRIVLHIMYAAATKILILKPIVPSTTYCAVCSYP